MRKFLPFDPLKFRAGGAVKFCAVIAIAGALSLVSCTSRPPSGAVPGANCATQGAGAIAHDSSGDLYVCK